MSQSHNEQTRWGSVREDLRGRRAAREARKAFAQDLAAFESPNDLVELSAILARHADADTEDIRGIVNWTVAA